MSLHEPYALNPTKKTSRDQADFATQTACLNATIASCGYAAQWLG